MATKTDRTVNLDALIQREDFETLNDGAAINARTLSPSISLGALIPGDRLDLFRKPDFQRETSEWTPEIITTFITSVADGDVVPALILWRSEKSNLTYVIDGAHRLSALIAWVNNDYGDGDISKAFYNNRIPAVQIEVARTTRELVENAVGKYSTLKARKDKSPLALSRSANIHSEGISVQSIQGDAVAAEKSYMRINSTAVAISSTERKLILSRRFPAGIATRALMHAGTGYQYWSRFGETKRKEIAETALLIFDQLIKPISDYPAAALSLPSSKRGYSAESMQTIFDLVSILNSAPKGAKHSEEDGDGVATLAHLEHIRRVTENVFGKHPGSLALHPALYCYDASGKFVGKAFIGAIEFVRWLAVRSYLLVFTIHRKSFEDFLIKHSHVMTQIGKVQGSGGRRGVPAVVAIYTSLFDGLKKGKSEDTIIKSMQADKALNFIDWSVPFESDTGARFTSQVEAAAVIRATLEKDRCPECGGRFYIKDRSNDHRVPKHAGGKSVSSNLQLTHPYCNNSKEALENLRKKPIAK